MAEALIGIPKRGPWIERNGETLIQISGSIQETHTLEATVSAHPIEMGSTISDHVQLGPKTVSIDGVISAEQTDLRVGEAFALLIEMFEARLPFDLITGIRVYPSMVFERFSRISNKGTGSVLRFTADLKQLGYATSETVAVARLPKNARATDKQGPKAKEKTAAATAEEARASVLARTIATKPLSAAYADAIGGL